MPVRRRLTLHFALILCIIMASTGLINYILLQRNLTEQIDGALIDYSSRIQNSINAEGAVDINLSDISSLIPIINEFQSPGTYIQVLDKDGYMVAHSSNLGAQELPVNPSLLEMGLSGNSVIQNVAAGNGANLRMMVSPLYLQNETLLLEVARSSNYLVSTMNQAKWVIIISVSVALALTLALGGIIVRNSLLPVSKITRLARNIETDRDLDRRIEYKGPMDEIGELASTFNNMINRLSSAFKSQKHFVADASHELKSPLTVIQGNLDLIKRCNNKYEREISLKAIQSETIRMTGLVNDLLLLAELDSNGHSATKSISLKEALEQEIERFAAVVGKRKLCLWHIEDLSVRADNIRVKQMVTNLIDNAIKHTPDDGTIGISLFKDGGYARIEIEDSGEGIPSEHLPHIFERFYRVDMARSRKSGGAGLGLAIVKQIAEQQGGSVSVSSEAGLGTTFTVWLKI